MCLCVSVFVRVRARVCVRVNLRVPVEACTSAHVCARVSGRAFSRYNICLQTMDARDRSADVDDLGDGPVLPDWAMGVDEDAGGAGGAAGGVLVDDGDVVAGAPYDGPAWPSANQKKWYTKFANHKNEPIVFESIRGDGKKYLRSVVDAAGKYDVFLSLVCLLTLKEVLAPAGNYFMLVCLLCGACSSCEVGDCRACPRWPPCTRGSGSELHGRPTSRTQAPVVYSHRRNARHAGKGVAFGRTGAVVPAVWTSG